MTSTRVLRRLGVLAAAVLLTATVGVKPLHAILTDSPAPPPDPLLKQKTEPTNPGKPKKAKVRKKRKHQQNSEREFLRGYRAAYALVLERKYREGIAAMHAIGHDEHPDVANYIGYAYRKLGDYDNSKVWYEKALAADPLHVRTWSYYGMWQMEQGNRLKALDDLAKVKAICGNTTCRAFVQLKAVIDGTASY
jgi:tetratricopeptide (TPR) repeat protein